MSYSDYGGFAWKNGKPFPEAVDATLIGVVAPTERPLEQATGLKLDVLMPFYDETRKGKEPDYLTEHPHHCVLGSMQGLSMVGHKQNVTVVWNGKKLDEFPHQEDWSDEEDTTKIETFDDVEFFHPPFGYRENLTRSWEKDGWKAWARYIYYNHSEGVMMVLISPEGTVLSGVSGYGIGEHWWKDEEGFELKFDEEYEKVIGKKPVPWADEKFFFNLVSEFIKKLTSNP